MLPRTARLEALGNRARVPPWRAGAERRGAGLTASWADSGRSQRRATALASCSPPANPGPWRCSPAGPRCAWRARPPPPPAPGCRTASPRLQAAVGAPVARRRSGAGRGRSHQGHQGRMGTPPDLACQKQLGTPLPGIISLGWAHRDTKSNAIPSTRGFDRAAKHCISPRTAACLKAAAPPHPTQHRANNHGLMRAQG